MQLLVSLDETGPQLYEAEIVQIANADKLTKTLVVRTDSRLLERTGGIVQEDERLPPSCRMGSWLGRLPMCSQRTPPPATAFLPR